MTVTTDYLELDGNTAAIVMATPAWLLTNISPLLGSGAARGSDRTVPRRIIAYPRRRTVTEYGLDLFVDGAYDEDGEPMANPRQSVYDHLDYLIAELVDPPDLARGTREGTLHKPDGSTATAEVTVVSIDVQSTVGPSALNCTLVLSLPEGRFA